MISHWLTIYEKWMLKKRSAIIWNIICIEMRSVVVDLRVFMVAGGVAESRDKVNKSNNNGPIRSQHFCAAVTPTIRFRRSRREKIMKNSNLRVCHLVSIYVVSWSSFGLLTSKYLWHWHKVLTQPLQWHVSTKKERNPNSRGSTKVNN